MRTIQIPMPRLRSGTTALIAVILGIAVAPAATAEPLPATDTLDWEGDIASRMIDGVDRFLLRKLDESIAGRAKHWQRDDNSPEAFEASIVPNRERLAKMLGVRDPRVDFDAPAPVADVGGSSLVGRSERFDAHAIRWPVLADPDPNRDQTVVHGEGLLLVPRGEQPIADVIALPDADQTPEQICGLAEASEDARLPAEAQFARRLAESGCRVIVPTLVSRDLKERGVGGRRNVKLTSREYVYRSAFELGRHVIGYEVQKVLALVDWLGGDVEGTNRKIGVVGYGEGGMLALYSGALDPRIDVVYVSGYFGPREAIWRQPLDRNVFGLLTEFGDAELAAMMGARTFLVDDAVPPDVALPGEGGAPARIVPHSNQAVSREFKRAEALLKLGTGYDFQFTTAVGQPWPRDMLLGYFVEKLSGGETELADPPQATGPGVDAAARQKRQVDEMDLYSQLLLRESPFVRKEFMKDLDTSSLEAYTNSIEKYRRIFRDEVIGAFDDEVLPPNPRTRKTHETEKWSAYEVVLDVYPDVFAYGHLLLPKDLKLDGSERRPVVVCQHGLEGRPTDTYLGDHAAYHDFAAKLAERGFITFAPQNLYIFRDRFRTLQRKANPLGKTLFSIITPQHQQIVDWLQSLPYVDPDRVAFYGLSYGGKTAMRVPALVTDYCLAICSADFNEWVLKNASTRHAFSYVWTGEYEIFEWDLGSTFNYAEMAALICPRPFMVERGHFDGVGWDEYVAYEFAKVRNLYQARLGIGERCEIEWFVGPHTIHGEGTFDFLHRHLDWPPPSP